MAKTDFIPEQLSATRSLIKFIKDHQGGVDEDLMACLKALERKDIDTAVRLALSVKPWGMCSLTDWCPPIVQPEESLEYNKIVLEALVTHWCNKMSRSFEKKRVWCESQVGELDARLNSKGFVRCPFCRKTFSSESSSSWDGSRHVSCGVRLHLVPAKDFPRNE
jgi:hypothetical protein